MADRKVVQGTLELLILRTLVFGPLLVPADGQRAQAAGDRAEPVGRGGSGDGQGAQARVRRR